MTLLSVESVNSGYQKVQVLHEISLSIGSGEMVAVIGPNGAGKSTLMKTISGLITPYSGRIYFDQHPIHGQAPDKIAHIGLAYVPQGQNVFGSLSVQDNLEMSSLRFSDADQRISEVLKFFPILRERARQRAKTLSGGERQMLAIGSALLARPKLLLLDEPSSGLAPQMVQVLVEQIVAIHRAGTSIIWVVEEHPTEVLGYADRVYFLEGGEVRRTGTGVEFLEDEHFVEMFLGAH